MLSPYVKRGKGIAHGGYFPLSLFLLLLYMKKVCSVGASHIAPGGRAVFLSEEICHADETGGHCHGGFPFCLREVYRV